MGFAVAAAAREAGADVTIVCGPVSIATPPGVKRIDVESAADMLNAVMKNIDGVDIFVATAAVADYRPANPVECKIKKTSESMDLKMERTVDILATVAARAPRAIRGRFRGRDGFRGTIRAPETPQEEPRHDRGQ